ncbi:ankyrin repeat-containing domain protein [Hypoxylon sp. FL1150]|nr:ankyrin repeat-containing domain protein [Hypoxylon sp. FL1150]
MALTTTPLSSLVESLTCQESEGQVKKSTIHVPSEIILEICQYLSQADKFHLALTSTKFTIPAITSLLDQDSEEDNSALFWAVTQDHHHVLSQMLTRRPELVNYYFQENHLYHRGSYMIKTGKFMTPLCTAIRLRCPKSLEVLLSFDADPNLRDQEPIFGHQGRWSPIQWAVSTIKAGEGFHNLVSLLTKWGADINVSSLPAPSSDETEVQFSAVEYTTEYTTEEMPPLFTQLTFDHPPGTSYEIEQSSATDFHNDLIRLINSRKSKMISLLKHGADPNHMEKSLSITPIFHVALALEKYKEDFYVKESRIWQNYDVEEQYNDIIIPTAIRYFDTLIEYGGDVKKSCQGTTALHTVIRRLDEYELVVNYLLRAGIDINATDSSGRTPLFELMQRVTPNFDALRRFIHKGAKVNHQDNEGCTPLHILVNCRGSQERLRRTIVLLLECGADASLTNKDGKTATELAAVRRVRLWPEIIEILSDAEHRARDRKNGMKAGYGRKGKRGRRGLNGRAGGKHGGNEAQDQNL